MVWLVFVMLEGGQETKADIRFFRWFERIWIRKSINGYDRVTKIVRCANLEEGNESGGFRIKLATVGESNGKDY